MLELLSVHLEAKARINCFCDKTILIDMEYVFFNWNFIFWNGSRVSQLTQL